MEEELAKAQVLEAERKKKEEERAAKEAEEAKAREQLEEQQLAKDTDHEVRTHCSQCYPSTCPRRWYWCWWFLFWLLLRLQMQTATATATVAVRMHTNMEVARHTVLFFRVFVCYACMLSTSRPSAIY